VCLRARHTIRGPPADIAKTFLDSQNHETGPRLTSRRPVFRSLLEITSPEVGRNKDYPTCTEFRGENHMFGVVIYENAIVFM